MSDDESEYEYSGGSDIEQDLDISESESSNSSDELEPDIALVRQWFMLNVDTPPPPMFPFVANPIINFQKEDGTTVLDYFNLFLDDDIIDMITFETNRYAQQSLASKPSTSNNAWIDFTSAEIRVFLSLIILQSVVKKPMMKQYWSKDVLVTTPVFPQCMPRKRFENIQKYLHFTNNETFDANNHPNPKLNKIWPVYEKLVNKFRSLCIPEKYITIDESLLLYKGRLGWVQYIPLKRARFGIKSYLLCESKSGYVWNFLIYTGKGTVMDDKYIHLPISAQVVMSLAGPLLNLGYCLTMDNFYNSPDLADLLIQNKTDVYGTLKKNRKGIPTDLKRKIPKGEVIGYQRGKVSVIKWNDKKEVYLLSTIHCLEKVIVKKRNEEISKPQVVHSYNDTMGGVDRVDQHLSTYTLPRNRGKKYYKKIFYHLVDLALWNSFILYKKCGGEKNALDYRLGVVRTMIEHYHDASSTRIGRPASTPAPTRLSGRHFPDFIAATTKKKNPTRQCVVCARKTDAKGKKFRKESRYYCKDCYVPLCVVPCFRVYHTYTSI